MTANAEIVLIPEVVITRHKRQKVSLNLFRVATTNCDLFTFVIVRAYDDFHLPVAVQIQRRDNFVSIGSVEAVFLFYVSVCVAITL